MELTLTDPTASPPAPSPSAFWGRVLGYFGLAAGVTWPAVVVLGQGIPGTERTDLWNSLWSLWFFQDAIWAGRLPMATGLLGHPDGGTILVADPLGALFAAPLIPWLGLPLAYSLLVLCRVAVAGLAAHGFARALIRDADPRAHSWAPWVAGVGYCTAPVLLSAIHNGTSEAFAGAPLVWATWACWRVARGGGWRSVPLAGAALFLAALASWYSAALAFVFCGALLVLGAGTRWRETAVQRLAALVLGLALVLPWAAAVHGVATGPDNLVGIKNPRELASVRRTTGPADPVGFVRGGDYRSPDFRVLSRYGEGFFHCHYIGWTLIIGALLAARRRGHGFLWMGGILAAALSLGPVLAQAGSPVIVLGDRAVPLPYIVVESLPGFSSLSLLYRLVQGSALAVALLAAVGLSRRRNRWSLAMAALILLEGRLVSPLGGLPDTVDGTVAPAVHALASAPSGAVMNFPVVGGRDYLYEQTVHGKPIAGGLNFPNNGASRKVWKSMHDNVDADDSSFVAAVSGTARRAGIRYVVVHVDPMARPDMHDEAIRRLKQAIPPLSGVQAAPTSDGRARQAVRVYPLW